MDDSELFDEVGTMLIVLSQMSLAFLGTFLNSLLFVTLKDLPDFGASTYHVLLANLCFSNIFTCTVLKPVTGIFTGYAYAKTQDTVGISFCQLYTFLTGTFLPCVPWSVLALSWQVFLEGQMNKNIARSYDTITRVENPTQRMLSKRGLKKFLHFQEKKIVTSKTYVEISTTSNKSSRMEKGLYPGQIIMLMMIWIGAILLGLESFETQIERGAVVREFLVNIDKNSQNYTRYVFFW